MRTIEFRGEQVTYDDRCLKSWKWQKAIASGDDRRSMGAVERLLCGKDEEVADLFGDDIEVMGELLGAIIEDSKTAKNSIS